MRALVFHGVGDVRCESVPDPCIESPGDVLLAVRRSAVCGSDLHVYRGRETGLDPGTVLGHELVGEVVEVGRSVRTLTRGDRVASPFTTSCGSCHPCRSGLTSRCTQGALFGWRAGATGLHGAQAEYVRVPLAETTLVKAPEGVSDEELLLAGDILSTGFFAADLAATGAGMTVAVLGCGAVGVMAVLACKERGAARVLAVDRVPARLELARRFGGEPVDMDRQSPVEAIREATDGRGVDAVLEVVGSPAASRLALDLVRDGGTIAAVGVHTEEHFAFSPGEAYDRNLTYRAGRCPARRYLEQVLPLLGTGRHDVTAVISHRLPLADGARAYDIFDRQVEGCTKAVLQ